MKCLVYVQDVNVQDENTGFLLTFKALPASGSAALPQFNSQVLIPFGSTGAQALSALKSSVVSVASGRGISMLTTDIVVYGASIS